MEKTEKGFLAKFGPLIYGGLAAVVVDQVTKYLVRANFRLYESVEVIPGFFSLTYIRNPGAAFSFLSDVDSPWVTRFFVLASLLAMGIIVGLYREAEAQNPTLKVALIIIFGGAVGNLIDRLAFGEVTDFLDFYLGARHWPAFNVADSCITIGVALILFQWFRPGHNPFSESGEKGDGAV